MRWRRAHTVILFALTLFILGAAPWVVGAATRSDDSPLPATAQAADRPAPPALDAVVAVAGATPARAPCPPASSGCRSSTARCTPTPAGTRPRSTRCSFGWCATWHRPRASRSLLRIGGDSTDGTWWPIRGIARPAGIYYALTQGWPRTARALAPL